MPSAETEKLHATILHSSGQVLSAYFQTPVDVWLQDDLVQYPDAPYQIVRLALLTPPANAPSTVIVKFATQNAEPLRFEWVALEFLNQVAAIQQIVPRFYGGSYDPALVVMEDLGADEPQRLGHFLDGIEPPKTDVARSQFRQQFAPHAESALIAFQRALGQLHAATVGLQDEYARLRQHHGAKVRSRHKVHQMTAVLQSFPENVERVGLPVSLELKAELATAVSHLTDPGPFLTFTHGDSTPANFFYTPNRSRFIDFETGDFRHALLDGTYARIRYLHSVWARAIPIDVQKRMLAVYRQELGKGCAAALDDAQFFPAFAACSAGWMAGLCQLLPRALKKDKKWGRSTFRQRIVAGLDHFIVLADELNLYPVLAETCSQMAHQLRQIWPESDCTLPLYRAFENT